MESKLVTGQNDARQCLIAVLHGSGLTMLKYISIQNLKWIYHRVQELCAFSLADPNIFNWCSAKPRPLKKTYVWQSIDNVEMYKNAKFYQNIPCGSRVISVYTKRARPVKMMLGKASSLFWIDSGWTTLKYISIQNLKQIYHGVQELWACFTKRAWPAKMMLGKASSPFCMAVEWTMFKVHNYVHNIWSEYATGFKSYEHFH